MSEHFNKKLVSVKCKKLKTQKHNSIPPIFIVAFNEEITFYLYLMDRNRVIRHFLLHDRLFRLADNYLLAIVFIYLKRARLRTVDYTELIFFTALSLAHSIFEDDLDALDEIEFWALGGVDLNFKYRTEFMETKMWIWRRMEYRAAVSRFCCQEGSPVWENLCHQQEMTFSEFIERSNKTETPTEWMYFDYKYMVNMFDKSVLESVRWGDLGFDELSGNDSSLWIGSRGAHTPCHMDTYGFNLVAQLYGRKMWLLVSPNDTSFMKPVRVPYEESSVYSGINFAAPQKQDLESVTLYKVILEPGEVLFVPRHWWHYVENLDLAISVNTWVPLDLDKESRVDEALVRHFVSGTCRVLPPDDAITLLNPNERDLLTEDTNPVLMEYVINECRDAGAAVQSSSESVSGELLRTVTAMSVENINAFVEERKHLMDSSTGDIVAKLTPSNAAILATRLINSYCHPDVIKAVKNKLFENSCSQHTCKCSATCRKKRKCT